MKEKESQQKKPGFDRELRSDVFAFEGKCYMWATHATLKFLYGRELYCIKIFENIRGYNIMEEKFMKQYINTSHEINSKLLEQGLIVEAMIILAGDIALLLYRELNIPDDENDSKVFKLMPWENELKFNKFCS